jgi:hypothetical protein
MLRVGKSEREVDIQHTREARNLGFVALTVVVMNRYIFWDITPCSPLKFS